MVQLISPQSVHDRHVRGRMTGVCREYRGASSTSINRIKEEIHVGLSRSSGNKYQLSIRDPPSGTGVLKRVDRFVNM